MSNRYPKKLKNCNKCKMNNYNNTANLKICSSSYGKNCNNKNFKNNKKVNFRKGKDSPPQSPLSWGRLKHQYIKVKKK